MAHTSHSPVLVLAPVLLLVAVTCARTVLGPSCSCEDGALDCANRDKSFLRPAEICQGALKVDLSHNRLKLFPDGLYSAKVVKASDNKLTRLPSPPLLNTGMQMLVLNNNEISDTCGELHAMSVLERLTLRRNRITSLDFLPQPCNLRDLDVDQNSISVLQGPLQNCTDLRFLSLGTNRITSLSENVFSQMKKLELLSVRFNQLTYVSNGTFQGLSGLKGLLLSDNQISSLSENALEGLSQLQRLYLSDNELRTLPERLFVHTPLLERLDVARNKLTHLPAGLLFGLNSLRLVYASRNRLSALPELGGCCDNLEQANFYNNSISLPSEEVLLAALRRDAKLDLSGNPIRPSSLRWIFREGNLNVSVKKREPRCGSVWRGLASIQLCVDVPCGKNSVVRDWVAAVRITMSNNV